MSDNCEEQKQAQQDKRGIGLKYDGDKVRPSLLPIDSLMEVLKVLEFGAKKYQANSWQEVEGGEKRYMDALMRHLFAYLQGEESDPETGLPHLSHMGCNVLFLISLSKARKVETERQKAVSEALAPVVEAMRLSTTATTQGNRNA